mgnify:CR=1 FL=1
MLIVPECFQKNVKLHGGIFALSLIPTEFYEDQLAEQLKNSTAIMEIDLRDVNFSHKGMEKIAEAMKHNCTIINLKLSHAVNTEIKKVIDHCCLRNQLIQNYLHIPDLVHHIKCLSYQAGLYKRPLDHVPSLRYQTTLFLKNSGKLDKLQHLFESVDDLKEFIKSIESVNQALNPLIPSNK